MAKSPEKVYAGGLFDEDTWDCTVGIDQSYTGFALLAMSPDAARYHGWVYASPLKGVDRLLDISEWIDQKLKALVDHGCFVKDTGLESPVLQSPAALISGQLYAVVQMALRNNLRTDCGAYPLRVAPSTLKKYVSGTGVAKKNTMLLHTFKNFGVTFDDDNIADAYGIARILTGKADNLPQRQVVSQLKDPKYRL
jgi:Holliday junction resolvasome RuvABC endonuclease subunit